MPRRNRRSTVDCGPHQSCDRIALSPRRCASTVAEIQPMYLLENPVLQRELLVTLSMSRAFVLLIH